MSVVLTTSLLPSFCEYGQNTLLALGLHSPLPASDTTYAPVDLTARLCAAYKLDHSSIGQRNPAIGRAWHMAAADLMIANADRSPWGWAHTGNLHVLDFWRDFEPASRFLLIYASPVEMLARRLNAPDAADVSITDYLDTWVRYNAELLRFYYENPDLAVLTHFDALSVGEPFAGEARRKLGLPADDPPTGKPAALPSPTTLLKLIAAAYVGETPLSLDLYAELESSADLPDPDRGEPVIALDETWSEYLTLKNPGEAEAGRREGETSARTAEALAATVENLHQELKIAKLHKTVQAEETEKELAELREELKRVKQEASAQIKEAPRHAPPDLEDAALAKQLDELEADNELLRFQLQQARDELERYFRKYQEARGESVAGAAPAADLRAEAPASAPSRAVIIDMRQFVEGENWHNAEADGRWAGPGVESTITLPHLAAGCYKVELEVVSAMKPEFVTGMKASLNGHQIPLTPKFLPYMKGRLAPLRRLKASLSSSQMPYPVHLTGQVDISAADAQSGETLKLIFPAAVSPTELGEPDVRRLTAMISHVKLEPA